MPDHYGSLGIFVAISTLLGILSTLQYATAIILPERDEDAISLLKGSLIILTMISVASLLLISIAGSYFLDLISASMLKRELFLVPLAIFCIGLNTSFVAIGNRFKKYKIISRNRIISAIATAAVSFAYVGFFKPDFIGLIIGYLVGLLVNSFFLAFSMSKFLKLDLFSNYDYKKIRLILKRYINFPRYTLITDFINGLINQLPIFILTKLTGKSSVGFYNMSNRMLGLPIVTISSGFSEVFRQRAASDFNTHGNCRAIFLKTAKSLFLISFLPFLVIILFGSQIFAFVFGDNWRTAGIYSQIMGIMFFFRFIVSPLSFVYYIVGKQREDFFLHILMVVLGLGSLYLGYIINNSTETMLLFYAISYSLIYIIYFIRSYQLSKGVLQ